MIVQLFIRSRQFSSSADFASFRNFNLPPKILVNLVANRITVPTEIQHKAFNHLSSGQSAVVISETGSGKTMAYLLPSIAKILAENSSTDYKRTAPHTLIISPTPQLAEQTHNTLKTLCEGVDDVRAHCISDPSAERLSIPVGTDILTTTVPVLDQIKHLLPSKFDNTQTVIVDEADWVLGDAFGSQNSPIDIINTLKKLRLPMVSAAASASAGDDKNVDDADKKMVRPRKQFVFAAATMPAGKKSVRTLIENTFHGIPFIFSTKSHQPVSSLKQHWVDFTATAPVNQKTNIDSNTDADESKLVVEAAAAADKEVLEAKERELLNILREEKPGSRILVFANTVETIDFIYDSVKAFVASNSNLAASMLVEKMHKRIPRQKRNEILPLFVKNLNAHSISQTSFNTSKSDASSKGGEIIENGMDGGRTQILIAGDSIARGYDFQSVSKVVQFDFATNVVSYLHRVGRTARGGNVGEVVNFVTDENRRLADVLRASGNSSAHVLEDIDRTDCARLFSRNKSLRTREKRREKRHAAPLAAEV